MLLNSKAWPRLAEKQTAAAALEVSSRSRGHSRGRLEIWYGPFCPGWEQEQESAGAGVRRCGHLTWASRDAESCDPPSISSDKSLAQLLLLLGTHTRVFGAQPLPQTHSVLLQWLLPSSAELLISKVCAAAWIFDHEIMTLP